MPAVKKRSLLGVNLSGHRLATVPDAVYADRYINRGVEGVQDFEIFDNAYQYAKNVLLYGPTGAGKTSALLAWAAYRNKPFYSVASNIAMDPSQMFGKHVPDESGKFVWADGGVTDIVRHGGVLLFNEINFMSTRIAPVIFELLDTRRELTLVDHKGEKIRAHHPNCWCDLPLRQCQQRYVLLAADMNPDYQGTSVLNDALRNRFSIQIEWDYHPPTEARLVKSETLLEIAANGRKLIGSKLETPIPTNALMEFEEAAKHFSLDFAIANFVGRFTAEERPAIKGVLDTCSAQLEADFTGPSRHNVADWNQLEGPQAYWMDDDADASVEEEAFFW